MSRLPNLDVTTQVKIVDDGRNTETADIGKCYEYFYFNVNASVNIQLQKKTPSLWRVTTVPDCDSALQKSTYYNMWNSPIQDVLHSPLHGWFSNFSFYANGDENPTSTESPNVNPNDLQTAPIQKYYSFDSENNQNASWLFIDGSHDHILRNIPPLEVSRDRLSKIEAVYTNLSGAWFRVTNTYVYLTISNATSTRVSSARKCR